MKVSQLFFVNKKNQKFFKKILISFEDLQGKSNFVKFHGCGSKIEPATSISILKFNWWWQAQFLNHTQVTLEKYAYFLDLHTILVTFNDSPNQTFVIWNRQILLLNDRPTLVLFWWKYISLQRHLGVGQKLGVPCQIEF